MPVEEVIAILLKVKLLINLPALGQHIQQFDPIPHHIFDHRIQRLRVDLVLTHDLGRTLLLWLRWWLIGLLIDGEQKRGVVDKLNQRFEGLRELVFGVISPLLADNWKIQFH
jgi:hypothetical protein